MIQSKKWIKGAKKPNRVYQVKKKYPGKNVLQLKLEVTPALTVPKELERTN